MVKFAFPVILLAAGAAWAADSGAEAPRPERRPGPGNVATPAPVAASLPFEPPAYPYPSPKWEEFLRTADVGQFGHMPAQGRGRFRPVDTAARELLRVFFDGRLHNIDILAYKDVDGKAVREPPALTLWGVSLAAAQYYNAPLFTIVSDKLRQEMFGHHLADYEALIDAAQGDTKESARLRDAMEVYKKRVLDASRPHAAAYREVLDELLAAYKRRTRALSGKMGPMAGTGGAAARERKAKSLAERVAGLETINSVQRAELRKELFDDFRDGMAASGGAKAGDHLNTHLTELARKLDYFDNAAAQLQVMPVSGDPNTAWEAPDSVPLKVAASNDHKIGDRPKESIVVESFELSAGKFLLPPGWEEVDEAGLRAFIGKWRELKALFAAGGDASKANALVAEIAQVQSGAHPQIHLGVAGRPLYYPSESRMAAEDFYNRQGKFTWVWMLFLGAVCLLSLAMLYRSGLFLVPGLAVFGLAFLITTTSFGFRLFLAQRGSAFSIPISSQYESLLWCSFFGCVVATALAAFLRNWTSVACLIGVSVLGGLVMIVSDFMPIGVSTEVSPENPVLRAALLPFHVGSMVGGYALIAIAMLPAVYYMIRWFASGGGAEERIELTNIDRFQNLLIQGVFGMLLVGLIPGAAWGDVAWGRWWGWDPKETWAFITWMVYLIVIHVRLIVRDRGPATACMAIWGFTVMLFTWFGTNYGLTRGVLHAYSGVESGSVHNVVPYIWLTLTGLMPITGGFMPGGVAMAARSVHLSRTDRDAAGGKNLLLGALGCWGFLAFTAVLLFVRYGTTPDGAWLWFWPTPANPIDGNTILPKMSLEDAEFWAPKLMLGFWAVLVAALSFSVGWLITLVADKSPGYNGKK